MGASGALGRAMEQEKAGDYRRANILLRDGLETLGPIFLGEEVLDDTGQKLSLAWGEEWEGRLRAAALIRQDVLANRLASYARLQNLQQCPAPEEAAHAELVPPPVTSE